MLDVGTVVVKCKSHGFVLAGVSGCCRLHGSRTWSCAFLSSTVQRGTSTINKTSGGLDVVYQKNFPAFAEHYREPEDDSILGGGLFCFLRT